MTLRGQKRDIKFAYVWLGYSYNSDSILSFRAVRTIAVTQPHYQVTNNFLNRVTFF